MKKKWLIIPILVFALIGMGTFLTTMRLSWIAAGTIDATAASADSVLGVAERDYASASVLDNCVVYNVLRETNAIEVRFILTTNNADVDIDVWAGREELSGNMEMARVCTLDVVCGQQDASDATHHFADTINITNNEWVQEAKVITPGADHQARLILDVGGYKKIIFHGFGTFDEDCIIEVSGY